MIAVFFWYMAFMNYYATFRTKESAEKEAKRILKKIKPLGWKSSVVRWKRPSTELDGPEKILTLLFIKKEGMNLIRDDQGKYFVVTEFDSTMLVDFSCRKYKDPNKAISDRLKEVKKFIEQVTLFLKHHQ